MNVVKSWRYITIDIEYLRLCHGLFLELIIKTCGHDLCEDNGCTHSSSPNKLNNSRMTYSTCNVHFSGEEVPSIVWNDNTMESLGSYSQTSKDSHFNFVIWCIIKTSSVTITYFLPTTQWVRSCWEWSCSNCWCWVWIFSWYCCSCCPIFYRSCSVCWSCCRRLKLLCWYWSLACLVSCTSYF